jgi:eukaryotic-like serine/threonine-protein kinase
MSPERWQQINQIFYDALARPAAARADFLAQACGADEELRGEVLTLLAADGKANALLEQPLGAVAAELWSGLPSTAPLPAALNGTQLGVYQIIREIGRGGMGEVYLAQDQKLNRRVALKLLPARFTHDPERLHRFRQEARAASALNHPNIVTIFDIGEQAGQHFMATEFVAGQTLRAALQDERFAPAQALDIVIQVASALEAAHQAGIIHRDIKPENLMLRPDGYVKVLDFGLAKLTEPSSANSGEASEGETRGSDLHPSFETRTGAVLGTVDYMSPEQARGQKVDARTDIFSLGVVLYELLTGARPFAGATRNHVLVAILDQEPPPLSAHLAAIPVQLPQIIERALAKDRADRYQSATAFRTDLQNLKQELDSAARLPSAGGGATPFSAKPQRRKMASLVVALAGCVLLAALSFLLWQWLGPRPAQLFAVPERLQLTKLTNSGRISTARLSPDGRLAAYQYGRELWISQLAEGNANRLLPATDGYFTGMYFSRDSTWLYYCSRPASGTHYTLYQIPVVGGTPRKLLEGVRTLAVSPVDGRLVLLRSVVGQPQFSVSLAQPDGSDERLFFTTDHELDHFAWSPDGQRVAYIRTGKDARGYHWDLVERRLADGREQVLVPHYRYEIGGPAWLPDSAGLLFCAEDEAKGVRQIWRVDYRTRARRNVTNDLNNYYGLSLSADGSKLLTAVQDRPARLYTAPLAEPERVTPLPLGVANYRETAWLPDGRLVYSLGVNGQFDVTGQRDLWVMAFDGSQPLRLTSDRRGNWMPAVSADGRFIVYVSRRSGDYNLWRCDPDGGHNTQLTFNGGTHPRLTPDGQWVYFRNQNALWKMPLAGGTPVNVVPATSVHQDVSPDGKWLVYVYLDQELNRFRVAVRELAGTPVRQTFDIRPAYEHLRWAPDGRGLLFINDAENGVYLQPLTGPLRRLFAPPPGETVYAFSTSPDGQHIAYTIGTRTSDLVLLSETK